MGIRIESAKLSQAVRESLESGRRPDICIKTTGGCRIGLQAPFYRTSPDLTTILNDPRVVSVSTLQYGRYCERETTPTGGQANYSIDFMATSAQGVLDNASRQCGEGRPCETCGGFPPAKGIVDQFVEGMTVLLTSNPAILTCLAVQGVTCPLLALIPTQQRELALQIFRTQGMVGLADSIRKVCRALNIPASQCPAEAIANAILGQQQSPPNPQPYGSGRTAPVWVWLNNTLIGVVTAEQISDGTWRVASFSIPVVGGTASFTINFSTCSLNLTSSNATIPSGIYVGRMIGPNRCQYALGNNTLVLALAEGGNVQNPSQQNGPQGLSDEQIKTLVILGGIMLLGLILVSGR